MPSGRTSVINEGSNVRSIEVSVVVPTRNERENIGPLIERLLRHCRWGSRPGDLRRRQRDDTPQVIAVRRGDVPHPGPGAPPGDRASGSGGLGGAVVAGLRLAEGRVAVVMDGDLQHPPETIPDLIATHRAGRRGSGGGQPVPRQRRGGWPGQPVAGRGVPCRHHADQVGLPPTPAGRLGSHERVLRPPTGRPWTSTACTGGIQDPPGGGGPLPAEGGGGRLHLRPPELGREQGRPLHEGLRFATHLARLRVGHPAHAPPTAGRRLRRGRGHRPRRQHDRLLGPAQFGHLHYLAGRGGGHTDLDHLELRRHGAVRLLREEEPGPVGPLLAVLPAQQHRDAGPAAVAGISGLRPAHPEDPGQRDHAPGGVRGPLRHQRSLYLRRRRREEYGPSRHSEHQGRTDRNCDRGRRPDVDGGIEGR